MTPALTPSLALAYLRELSADIRDGVVLGARGALLAGEPALAPAARELVAGLGSASEAEGRAKGGTVLASRAGEVAIVLVCGPQALPRLARHDLRLVLGDLGAPGHAATAVARVPEALVGRLIAAAVRGPGE